MEAEIAPQLTREEPGRPLVVGRLTLTPIARVRLDHQVLAGRLVVVGEKRPVAVIVRSAEREWRLEVPGAGEEP